MIAVDTNILLRYLLDDDAMQSRKARHLFETKQLLLITDVVLAETIWTLKGKRYAAHLDDIAKIVMRLLEEVNVIFEDRQAIWSALNDFVAASPVKTANGIKWANFSDALIVNKAKMLASALQQPYLGTYTFDLAALALDGTKRA